MVVSRTLAIFLLAFILLPVQVFGQQTVSGKVIDSSERVPVAGAAVTVQGNASAWAITDSLGRFTLKAAEGQIEITCLGYQTLISQIRPDGTYLLVPDSFAINEVVVTATESHGLTSSSRIGQEAIQHIQPSSFADLLELLPGGRATDPVFGSAQAIDLRAAPISSSDYATSSLGTSFVVDGIPVNTNANMQATPSSAYSSYGSDFVNRGVDMRSLTTEDIESVEIVRGIPSVEYGDLTSGLVNVTRRKGGDALRARFKADMKSKLFYVGKDMEWGATDKLTMNVSANYLDAASDPRNVRQSYKRLTGSFRMGKTWSRDLVHSLSGNIDYTGSFDDEKSDEDLDFGNYGPVETYKSSYNKISLGTEYSMRSQGANDFFRSLTVTASLSYEKDLISRWKYAQWGTVVPLSTATEPGEYDVTSVPSSYETTLEVDGRPFYAYANAVARFRKDFGRLTNSIKAGLNYNMSKNFGKGTIFDPSHPFSTDMNVRPRDYSEIPASSQFAAFLEDNSSWTHEPTGIKAEWLIGLRVSAMAGAGSAYSINLKPYFDPRLNLRLEKDFGGAVLGLSGGAGWHTKYPTMDQLYPDKIYYDVVQMNYWPVEEELRRINVKVEVIDPTNYELKAARNFKWEVAADLRVGKDFSVSIDYFKEDMTSGFRTSTDYMRLLYKDYDESSIDKSTLTGPPSLETTPWVQDTMLLGYSRTTNGSRTRKEGVEFTVSLPRISAIRTKATISGAYFRTRYSNSQPEYYRPSTIVSGEAYPYVGMYNDTEGYLREVFNTNFMFDTQIPRLGMIFSTSFQCQWFSGSQTTARENRPDYYIDYNLETHPFTDADAEDGVKGQMLRTYTESTFAYSKIPFSMNINFKATKKLYGDKIAIALFVNKIIDVSPDYYNVVGNLVRRSVLPYFGMELNFKL